MKRSQLLSVLGFMCLSSMAFAHGGSEASGGGNPASILCEEVGGQLEGYQESRGEGGLCVLGRARVEEWTLYRTLKSGGTQATQTFLAHPRPKAIKPGPAVGMPNPASVYCGQIGGTLMGIKK